MRPPPVAGILGRALGSFFPAGPVASTCTDEAASTAIAGACLGRVWDASTADYLRLTIETVSRPFSRMRTKGLIGLPTRQEIVILRPAAFAQLAGDGFVDHPEHATSWPGHLV
jgi:hypothetical protein